MKDWISLGIHQGERTLENCNRIIKILQKNKIPCQITTLSLIFPLSLIEGCLFYKRLYWVEVPNWRLWDKALELI